MSLTARRSMVMYDFDTEAATAGCLDMSGEQFTEPFMIDTIERRLRERPRPFALAGDWQEVCEVLGDQPSLPLQGMIFHTGRCGSTLVANALSAMSHVMVMKESPFLSASAAEAVGAGGRSSTEAQARIRALQRYCLPPTSPSHTHQVWKFASWNILAQPVWNQAFPGAGEAFVWRPCLEVMESEISAPPLWANGKGRVDYSMFDKGRAALLEAGLTDLPKAQTVSLAAWISVALSGIELGERGGLILPYAAVRADLGETVKILCDHFGLPVTAEELDRAAEVRRFYSKDPGGKRPFQDAPGPSALDEATARRIRAVVGGLEERLVELGR